MHSDYQLVYEDTTTKIASHNVPLILTKIDNIQHFVMQVDQQQWDTRNVYEICGLSLYRLSDSSAVR